MVHKFNVGDFIHPVGKIWSQTLSQDIISIYDIGVIIKIGNQNIRPQSYQIFYFSCDIMKIHEEETMKK